MTKKTDTSLRINIPVVRGAELETKAREHKGRGHYHDYLVGLLQDAVKSNFLPAPARDTRLRIDHKLKDHIRRAARQANLSPAQYALAVFDAAANGHDKAK